MKNEAKGTKSGQIFGAPPRALAADELDRVFGGQYGPPAPTPPSPPPTTQPTPWGPIVYKNVRSYDLYGQEN